MDEDEKDFNIFQNMQSGIFGRQFEINNDEIENSIKYENRKVEVQKKPVDSSVYYNLCKPTEDKLIRSRTKLQWEKHLTNILLPLPPAENKTMPCIVGWIIKKPSKDGSSDYILQRGNNPNFVEATKAEFNAEWEYTPVKWPVYHQYLTIKDTYECYRYTNCNIGNSTAIAIDWEGNQVFIGYSID